MTVSPDLLTKVTATLPVPTCRLAVPQRAGLAHCTESFRQSTERTEQDAAVSRTKTSPRDLLQLGSKPSQSKGAWPRSILVLRSRETGQFQKRLSSSGFAPVHHVDQGSWRIPGYAQCNRHIQSCSPVLLQCAALGYARTHCNSTAPRSHSRRPGST